MSDLEDLDADQMNELESLLYASIHYNDGSSEKDIPADGSNVYPIHMVSAEPQTRIVTENCIINNPHPKITPRYWGGGKEKTPAQAQLESATKADVSEKQSPANGTSDEPKSSGANTGQCMPPPPTKLPLQNRGKQVKNAKNVFNQKKQQLQQQQPQSQQIKPKPKTAAAHEPEQFDQRLLIAIPSGPPLNSRGFKNERSSAHGPLTRVNRKLEQLQKIEQKKLKSKQVRANKRQQQQQQQQPTEQEVAFINLGDVDSDNPTEDDDVIHVPLPPPVIIDVDASDEDAQAVDQAVINAVEQMPPYIEENAMDVDDLKLGASTSTNNNEIRTEMAPPFSPCNSVMSSDDFIVQKDTSRLLADQARATDEDLLVLTENAMALHNKFTNIPPAATTATADSQELVEDVICSDASSEYEFVPPSRIEEIKQNYRVDEQQFRALDVYESESDLAESGVYSKGIQKPTIIRSLDSCSESSDVEEIIESPINVSKTKRLRKRRSSSTNQSQSEPNNNDGSDTDSDNDEVKATGVPGIARGMALERCKSKIKRPNARRHSVGGAIGAEAPKSRKKSREEATIEEASDDSMTEQAMPSAREIAEKILQPEAGPVPVIVSNEIDIISIPSDENSADGIKEKEDDISVIRHDDDDVGDDMEEQVTTSNQEQPQSQEEQQIRSGDLTGWNDEMKRFYNDSWKGEQFNVKKIQKTMNPQKQLWKINTEDRYPGSRSRFKGKCTNCYEYGHMRAKCTQPRKAIVCSICGTAGHIDTRCPNSKCLGCGTKQPFFVKKCSKCPLTDRQVCELCKLRGHCVDYCPDKWRRYHATTSSNGPLNSNVEYKPKHSLFCSYCAARGHLFENCRQRIGEYRSVNFNSAIISYEKVNPINDENLEQMPLPNYCENIASANDIPFHFEWNEDIRKNGYYARFLKDVGLGQNTQKRKSSHNLESPVPQKLLAIDSVKNPASKARKKSNVQSSSSSSSTLNINKEIKISSNINTSSTQSGLKNNDLVVQQTDISTNFETVPKDINNAHRFKQGGGGGVVAHKITNTLTHDLDSDSNYSFSEHFEVPTSTTSECSEDIQSGAVRKSGPMDNLPDVIPLSRSDNDNDNDDNDITTSDLSICNEFGISMCVNKAAAAAASSNREPPVHESPCEGKILMSREQTEYLLSPEGREFLTKAAKQCNVTVRMEFKEYGYVLIIHGQKNNQEDLQIMLLKRNQEVKAKTSEFQSQKPPKRIDILIKYLRDGINSLNCNLGNASTHYNRMKSMDQLQTKNGHKAAERSRRTLNMILIGQAGLLNGDMHLDQLVVILKQLVDQPVSEDNASSMLRSEVEEHWRMIFTPYRHPNYESLLQSYNKLALKNRFQQLQLDRALLGLAPINRHHHHHHQHHNQRELPPRREQKPPPPPPPVWPQNLPPPSQHQHQHQQQQQKNNRSPVTLRPPARDRMMINQHQQQQQPPSFQQSGTKRREISAKHLPINNPQQRASTSSANLNLNPECAKLLAEMGNGGPHGNAITDAAKSSTFWSRESFKYIDDLFTMTANPDTVQRLRRISERSQSGQLSYNDYRAIIKLHSMLSA